MSPSAAAPALSREELSRYRRQLSLPQVGVGGQERLKAASVLCVGAGGLGSPLALYLAAAGVGRLGLVDGDAVEASNLNRQVLYDAGQVGRGKAEVAAERLRGLNPALEVVARRERLGPGNAAELIAGYDLVCDGSDNFPTRYALNDACVAAGKPLVHGAVYRFEGQVSVFFPPEGPCYRCLHPQPPRPEAAPSCAEAGVLGALPGVIGSLQALEALKLLLGAGRPALGRLLVFDGLSLEWRTLALKKDPDCRVCGGRRAATQEDAMPAIPEISVEDLKAKLDRKEKLQLIDVREPEEHETARIEGSKLIPLATLPQSLASLDKAQDVVVHCHHGGRSARAVQFLKDKGFKAFNLAGGINAWSERIDPAVPQY